MRYYKVKALVEVEMSVYGSEDDLEDGISEALDNEDYIVGDIKSYDYSIEDDGVEWDIAHEDKVSEEMEKRGER